MASPRSRPARFALVGIGHESSSFRTQPTVLADFELVEGVESLASLAGTATEYGGILAACADRGDTVDPVLVAEAEPGGPVATSAFELLSDRIAAALEAAGPLDAVIVDLHGAGLLADGRALEPALLERIRAATPSGTPLVGLFDLHGNVEAETLGLLDVSLSCREYPHTDFFDVGHDAVAFASQLAAGAIRPVTVALRLPMLMPASTTLAGPAAELKALCSAEERDPLILRAQVFHGFPMTDVSWMGATVVVVADGDRAKADDAARRIARWIWERRERFLPAPISPADAVAAARAKAASGHPVVINEASDNPGGGGPGDATHLLRAMLDAGLEDSAFATIFDPEVVKQARAAGVGAPLRCRLGGKGDALHGDPLELEATVAALSDGTFQLDPRAGGREERLGRSAALRVGGLQIVVASARRQVRDCGPFEIHGIDISRCRVVGLKSQQHFRAVYGDLASEILTADAPGLTSMRMDALERVRVRRPIWPLDPQTELAA